MTSRLAAAVLVGAGAGFGVYLALRRGLETRELRYQAEVDALTEYLDRRVKQAMAGHLNR